MLFSGVKWMKRLREERYFYSRVKCKEGRNCEKKMQENVLLSTGIPKIDRKNVRIKNNAWK